MKKSEKYLIAAISGIMFSIFGPAFAAANNGGANLILSLMLIGIATFSFSFYKSLSELDNE